MAFVLAGSLVLVALRRRQAAHPAAPRTSPAVRRARLVTFGVTAVFVPVVGIAYVARQPLGLDALFVEDGPSEWFTALVFFAAAAVLGVRAFRAFRARDVGWRLTAPLCAGVAILAALIALEEISYGQRLFGVATPDWLADANDQHEINLHNLDNTLMFAAYPVGGLLLFAAMLATAWWWDVLHRAGGYLRALADLLPDPALLPLAAAIALVAQHPGFNELVEIFAALLLLLYLAWPQHAPAPQAERRALEQRRPASAHVT